MKKLIVNIFLAIEFFPFCVHAEETFSSARQYAMSGAYSAMARGAEALFLNPANLGFPQKKKFSINIIGLGAELSNNTLSHLMYQKYVGTYLDADEIDEILDEIPSSGLNINSNAKIQGFSIGIGSFAFGIRGFSNYSSYFSREIFELVLMGNELNRVYKFNPIKGDGITAAAVGAAFGKSFKFEQTAINAMAFGLMVRYLHGFSYARVTASEFYTQTTAAAIEGLGHLSMNYAEGGNGFSVTSALSFELVNDWTVSFVLHNSLSEMIWNVQAKALNYDFQIDKNNIEAFLENGGSIDSLFVTADSSRMLNSFSTRLPSILNFGLSMPFGNNFNLNFEIENGFERSSLSSNSLRILAGAELAVAPFFYVRSGVSVGGNFGNQFSGGFGIKINNFCWDLAARTFHGITSETSKGFGVATSLAIRY
ncbi:MAG: hypothetical protein EHM72_01120 [Calditrichaeota bacterium]|nr:MAG: hypothetical protein EHM72_01120 [Calditrichota bacterium]